MSVLVDGELIEQPISGDLQNLNASQFAQQQEPTRLLWPYYLLLLTSEYGHTTYSYPLLLIRSNCCASCGSASISSGGSSRRYSGGPSGNNPSYLPAHLRAYLLANLRTDLLTNLLINLPAH